MPDALFAPALDKQTNASSQLEPMIERVSPFHTRVGLSPINTQVTCRMFREGCPAVRPTPPLPPPLAASSFLGLVPPGKCKTKGPSLCQILPERFGTEERRCGCQLLFKPKGPNKSQDMQGRPHAACPTALSERAEPAVGGTSGSRIVTCSKMLLLTW